jgi:anaerobic magnesium-protoporphyrin IX monomethyl ester cyclase
MPKNISAKPMRIAFCVAEDFNLGVAYVISYLKSEGHEVNLFIDYNKNFSIIRKIYTYSPDLICISCVTANSDWAIKLSSLLQNFHVIVGGVHPTLCPEDFNGIEICQGDGIEYFGGQFNPDTLWPDREIFFKQLPPHARAYQLFMTSFGCPFKCSYCNSPQLHKKVIRRSVDGCIKELIHLKERGLKYVLFVDDIFILNKDWINSFLRDYNDYIRLPFTCFGHVKVLDNDICGLLKRSMCECVWIGVQSGVESVRKEILNRYETNDEIRRACGMVKGNRLKLMIDHIFGIPGDNYEKLLESFNFYKTLKPDVLNCYELLYFPKAEINKFGSSKAMYQRQGGRDYKRYAKSFTAIPLFSN